MQIIIKRLLLVCFCRLRTSSAQRILAVINLSSPLEQERGIENCGIFTWRLTNGPTPMSVIVQSKSIYLMAKWLDSRRKNQK